MDMNQWQPMAVFNVCCITIARGAGVNLFRKLDLCEPKFTKRPGGKQALEQAGLSREAKGTSDCWKRAPAELGQVSVLRAISCFHGI